MRNLITLLFLAIAGMFTIQSCLPEGDYKTSVNYQPATLDDGWETADASSVGFDVDRLQDIYEMMFSADRYITSRSLLIVRDGKLVSESYFRDTAERDGKSNIRGITKSVTSLLFGMAWDNQLVQLDQRLYRYIPEYFDGDMNKRDITLEDLLTMKAGLEWDNELHTPDLFNTRRFPSTMRVVITKPFATAAGSEFYYNHGTPQLTMGVIRKVFEQPDTDTIVNMLFEPLGIDDFVWEQHTDGLHIGGLGLHLKPRDLALLGQFCLQKGWWQGKQVVSSSWINASTKARVGSDMTGSFLQYGYYWWIHAENNALLSMGDGGQFLYIVPGKDLVIVHTAGPHTGSGYEGILPEDFLVIADLVLAALK